MFFDPQGNILALLDKDGNTVVKYTYDAWGNHTVEDGTECGLGTLNPFRYRGYYYDTETGLYYLQTRYYDPEIGRFVTIDDVAYLDPDTVGGLNLYAYCNNNPVMCVDPMGTVWNLLIGALIGAVVGLGTSLLTNLPTKEERSSATEEELSEMWWDYTLKAVLSTVTGAISGAFAASGWGLVRQILVNAGISATSGVLSEAIDSDEDTTFMDYIEAMGFGALSGALSGLFGGKGTASTHIQNSFSRFWEKGKNILFFWKKDGFRYYASQVKTQAIADGKKSFWGILKSNIPTWIESLFTWIGNN